MISNENKTAEKEAYLKPETKKYDPIAIVAGSPLEEWRRLQQQQSGSSSYYMSYYT